MGSDIKGKKKVHIRYLSLEIKPLGQGLGRHVSSSNINQSINIYYPLLHDMNRKVLKVGRSYC